MIEQTYFKSIDYSIMSLVKIRSLNESIRYFRCEKQRISITEYGDEMYKLHLMGIYRMRIDALKNFKISIEENYK